MKSTYNFSNEEALETDFSETIRSINLINYY